MATRPKDILNKLKAVNQMLLSIKEQPVPSLEELNVLSEASIAAEILDLQILEVLSDGWPCNSIQNKTYSPDALTGKIMLPPNVMRCRASDPSYNFTELNGVLFDTDNQIDTFTQGYQLDLLLFMEFDDLPWELQNLSMWHAMQDFERKVRGSSVMNGYIQGKIQDAQVSADKYKSNVGRHSIFDSYRPWSIINRRMNPIGGNLKL